MNSNVLGILEFLIIIWVLYMAEKRYQNKIKF